MVKNSSKNRGCVFFNFGTEYIIKLYVAIYSLRKIYDGAITLMLDENEEKQKDLANEVSNLSVDVQWFNTSILHKSTIKQFLLRESPYDSTLIFDGDLLFLSPIDKLWEPLERNGVLATRFYPNPFGLNGSPKQHQWGTRIGVLLQLRPILSEEEVKMARYRILKKRIDINIGVFGYVKDKGAEFLNEFTSKMDLAFQKGMHPGILDEFVIISIIYKHPHCLADEKWNCPADEFFRKTDIKKASITFIILEMAIRYRTIEWVEIRKH